MKFGVSKNNGKIIGDSIFIVVPRGSKNRGRPRREFSKEDAEKIRELRALGWTKKQLSKEFNADVYIINRALGDGSATEHPNNVRNIRNYATEKEWTESTIAELSESYKPSIKAIRRYVMSVIGGSLYRNIKEAFAEQGGCYHE